MSIFGFGSRFCTTGACSFSKTLVLPSSISVENLADPSSAISTCGVVPRMPMVATGVSTFMSPVFATLPATNVNVPLVRLNKVAVGLSVRVVNEFVQGHAGVAGQIECRFIGEGDADLAVSAGLHDIAQKDWITDLGRLRLTGGIGLHNHGVHMLDCDSADDGYDFSDGFCCASWTAGTFCAAAGPAVRLFAVIKSPATNTAITRARIVPLRVKA